ncbi:MAG: hypothetical protein GC136_02090 [Alphaproteobacteria bacterium]|nr:hypothetical protein [Alphaproteobacteria bacterium]
MSESEQLNQLNNAGAIIERFGGIRPMATKMNVPVTTVQGWKKRDAIPANRREEIIKVANDHNVSIQDLLKAPQQTSSYTGGYVPPVQAQDSAIVRYLKNYNITAYSVVQFLVFIALMGSIIYLGLTIFHVRDENTRLQTALLKTEKDLQSFMEKQPETLTQDLNVIEATAQALEEKIESLNLKTRELNDFLNTGEKNKDISERLNSLEQQLTEMAAVAAPQSLRSFYAKIQGYRQDPQQEPLLQESIKLLESQFNAAGKESATKQLEDLRKSDSLLRVVLEGVAPQELPKAAQLLALDGIRTALADDKKSYTRPLNLADKVQKAEAAQGNKNAHNYLVASLVSELAPYAEGGTPSVAGLAKEFDAAAGEIVVAYLNDPKVPLKEKAKARLNDVVQVKKSGDLVTGTETQVLVSKAQMLLAEGKVENAIIALQGLQGAAAAKAQPFLQQARVTLLGMQKQEEISRLIMSYLLQQTPAAE